MRITKAAAREPGHIVFRALIVAAIVLAAKTWSLAQAPGSPAGRMTSVGGSVELQRGSSKSNATLGMAVEVADHIGTGNPGHAIVTLTDQSRLEIGPLSSVVIDRYLLAPPGGRTTTSLSLFSGVMRSFVNTSAGVPSFEVNTPNAVAAARGTVYDTAYTEGITRPTFGDCVRFTDVSVDDGVVAVTNRGNPAAGTVEVPAGYEVTVPCDQAPTLPAPLGMTGAVSLDSSVVVLGPGPSVARGLPPPGGAVPPGPAGGAPPPPPPPPGVVSPPPPPPIIPPPPS